MPSLEELKCNHGVEQIIRTQSGYECVGCLREVERLQWQLDNLRGLWQAVLMKLDPAIPADNRIIGIINQALQARQYE